MVATGISGIRMSQHTADGRNPAPLVDDGRNHTWLAIGLTHCAVLAAAAAAAAAAVVFAPRSMYRRCRLLDRRGQQY